MRLAPALEKMLEFKSLRETELGTDKEDKENEGILFFSLLLQLKFCHGCKINRTLFSGMLDPQVFLFFS